MITNAAAHLQTYRDDSCDTIHVYCPILVYLSLLCRLVAVLTSAIDIKLGCVTNTSGTQCKSNTSMYMSFNSYPLQKLHKPNDDLVSSFKIVYSRDLQSIAMSLSSCYFTDNFPSMYHKAFKRLSKFSRNMANDD